MRWCQKSPHVYLKEHEQMTPTVISISIPAKSKVKDNLKEAVLSTCFTGSDGENVAGCTHAQAVLGKYADIIGGGVHLQNGGICLIRAKLHCLGEIPGGCVGK